MFDINPWELGILVVLFLIVFGPERIPEVMAQVGRVYRQVQAYADQATDDLTRELKAASIEADSVRRELEGTGRKAAGSGADGDALGAPATTPSGGAAPMPGPLVDPGLSAPRSPDPAGPPTPPNSASGEKDD